MKYIFHIRDIAVSAPERVYERGPVLGSIVLHVEANSHFDASKKISDALQRLLDESEHRRDPHGRER